MEDNPDDAALALRAFGKAGVPGEVVVLRDGIEALDYLLGTDPSPTTQAPCVVLLDLNLPRVDGLEVLRRLRADPRTRELPVVVMSSSEQEEDVACSYRMGANAYIRKPVDYAEFVETARSFGAFWLVLNLVPGPF